MQATLNDMTQERWDRLHVLERERLRDNSMLTAQLVGLEGWRVEVRDSSDSEPRRFIVGRSTGWRPVHLEVSRRSAFSGGPARQTYHSVRKLYFAR